MTMHALGGWKRGLPAALLGALLIAAGVERGQAQDMSVLTDLSQFLLHHSPPSPPSPPSGPTTPGGNVSSVTQFGANNSASVNVEHFSGNVTFQLQFGKNNVSTIEAIGNFNTLTAIQFGFHNNSNIAATGNNNNFKTVQVGSHLSYDLTTTRNNSAISVFQTNFGTAKY